LRVLGIWKETQKWFWDKFGILKNSGNFERISENQRSGKINL
jgi:hypothetical protein